MKKIYNENDLKNIYFLKGELKNIKYNLKIVKSYIDDSTMIYVLKYINSYDELLEFNQELHERLKFIRRHLKNFN